MPGAGRTFKLLSVLDKLIVAELLKTVSAILLVLVVIIVSQKFIKVLTQAADGNIGNDMVLLLLGLKTVIVTASFLPAAMFMAVLIVFGRMYQQQEIAAIASAGGGFFTLYRGIFIVLLPLTLFATGLSMLAAPWAEQKTQAIMHEGGQSSDIRGISAGGFREYSNGELIFYTERIDADGLMHDIFLQNRQSGKTGVVYAEQGRLQTIDGGLYLILNNGERHLGRAGFKDFIVESFQEYGVLIEHRQTVISLSKQAVPTRELMLSKDVRDAAEFQNRLNTPLATILLAFLAMPLAKVAPRSGMFGSLLVAFCIYFIYSNLQRLNYTWVTGGLLPAWLSYFCLNSLLLLVGVFLLLHSYGWPWLLLQLRGRRAV